MGCSRGLPRRPAQAVPGRHHQRQRGGAEQAAGRVAGKEMTPFATIVFGPGYPRKGESEEAALSVTRDLTSEERSQASDALLRKLDQAKREFTGPVRMHKELLRDPSIGTLVNMLLIINEPWIRVVVGRAKAKCNLRETVDEMLSTAMTGNGSLDADAGGAIGAVLGYEYDRCGGKAFTSYLEQAVSRTFIRAPKAHRSFAAIHSRTHTIGEEQPLWLDRKTRSPVA